jgi:hypothetical protein
LNPRIDVLIGGRGVLLEDNSDKLLLVLDGDGLGFSFGQADTVADCLKWA